MRRIGVVLTLVVAVVLLALLLAACVGEQASPPATQAPAKAAETESPAATSAPTTSAAPAMAATPAPEPQPPVAEIEIVPVTANADDPNVIKATLSDGETQIQMYTNGLTNVPVGVPVILQGAAADAEAPAQKYAWTLTTPTASKSALDKADGAVAKFTPDAVGVYKVDLVVSNEGGDSPMASVQIHAGTFVGTEEGGCETCHAETATWAGTGHATIFTEQIEGGADPANSHYAESCIVCHTTGYFQGADNGGFTDVQAETGWEFPALEAIQAGEVDFESFPAAIKNMANIQCEDCHGPAQQHVEDGAPIMAKTLDSGLCNTCHDGGGHHVKGTQFANSKHSQEDSRAWSYPTGPSRQDCVRCHSGAGFATFTENPTELASWDNSAGPLACASCHDPHGNGNTYQLRVVGKAVALPGDIEKDFGLSATCVECHNSRTIGADAVKGSTPHYSAAAEMLANTGGVDYGQKIADSPHGMIVGAAPMKDPADETGQAMLFGGATPGPCVTCHMYPTPGDAEDPLHNKVGAHSFNVVTPDGETDYVAACQSCHPGIEDFNITAKADYDGNGQTESVQTEVAGLLHTLEKAINDSGIKSVEGHPYFDRDDTANASDKQRNAIYNYLFVRGLEGTDGKAAAIHNFKRSVTLLQLSYKDLTGSDVPNATLVQ